MMLILCENSFGVMVSDAVIEWRCGQTSQFSHFLVQLGVQPMLDISPRNNTEATVWLITLCVQVKIEHI